MPLERLGKLLREELGSIAEWGPLSHRLDVQLRAAAESIGTGETKVDSDTCMPFIHDTEEVEEASHNAQRSVRASGMAKGVASTPLRDPDNNRLEPHATVILVGRRAATKAALLSLGWGLDPPARFHQKPPGCPRYI